LYNFLKVNKSKNPIRLGILTNRRTIQRQGTYLEFIYNQTVSEQFLSCISHFYYQAYHECHIKSTPFKSTMC